VRRGCPKIIFVENNLDTLVIALYVKIDDEREGLLRLPGRPPTLSHSELICLAVMQAMLGFESEARWLRYARGNLRHLFPFIPLQPGYNKRLRAALSQIKRIIRMLGRDTDFWEDPVWIADSTPVPCGTSRPTARRPEVAGWASYGYCRHIPAGSGGCALPRLHSRRAAGPAGARRPENRRAGSPPSHARIRCRAGQRAGRHPAHHRQGASPRGHSSGHCPKPASPCCAPRGRTRPSAQASRG
jgi:hypothetical protein